MLYDMVDRLWRPDHFSPAFLGCIPLVAVIKTSTLLEDGFPVDFGARLWGFIQPQYHKQVYMVMLGEAFRFISKVFYYSTYQPCHFLKHCYARPLWTP